MKKALLCVGNELRGDDGVGMVFGRKILDNFKGEWELFFGGDTPENELGKIRKFAPDILIVADAALGGDSGAEFVELDKSDEFIFSTHNIPLHILVDYMREFCDKVIFLAIFVQEKHIKKIDPNLTQEAKQAVNEAFDKFVKFDKIIKNS